MLWMESTFTGVLEEKKYLDRLHCSGKKSGVLGVNEANQTSTNNELACLPS